MRRGLATSRTKAQALVASGQVRVGGAVASKSARLVDPAEAVTVVGDPPRYVSRGGLKLEAALRSFGIDPTGIRAVDVGASTGGFTDCLLQHGAARVVALDVGRNQLHERLRADRRVVSLERTDVRDVSIESIEGPAALVVVDVSFISFRWIAAAVRSLASGQLVVLVKPQFEAGKKEADRGRGVIRDPEVRRRALLGVISSLHSVGAAIMGVMVSPITGAAGNAEFLLHADMRPEDMRPETVGMGDHELRCAVDVAVARAAEISRR